MAGSMVHTRLVLAAELPSLKVSVGVYGPNVASPAATVPWIRPLVTLIDSPVGNPLAVYVNVVPTPALLPCNCKPTDCPS